jgi:hypothetical protein
MQRGKTPIRRYAIYTRKSSEEGLEQAYASNADRLVRVEFFKHFAGLGPDGHSVRRLIPLGFLSPRREDCRRPPAGGTDNRGAHTANRSSVALERGAGA